MIYTYSTKKEINKHIKNTQTKLDYANKHIEGLLHYIKRLESGEK